MCVTQIFSPQLFSLDPGSGGEAVPGARGDGKEAGDLSAVTDSGGARRVGTDCPVHWPFIGSLPSSQSLVCCC